MPKRRPWLRLAVAFACCFGIATLALPLPSANATDFFCNGWFATMNGQVGQVSVRAPDPNGPPSAVSRAVFFITLADPLPAPQQSYRIDYQTVADTAVAGTDYQSVAGSETFQNDTKTTLLVTFPAIVVLIPYQNPGITTARTFHFVIGNAQGLRICGPRTIVVTILPFIPPATNTPTATSTLTSTPTTTPTATSTASAIATSTPTPQATPVNLPALPTPRGYLPVVER